MYGIYKKLVVSLCVEVLRSGQQFFSHVSIISCLLWLNQYYAADKVSWSRTQYDDSGES